MKYNKYYLLLLLGVYLTNGCVLELQGHLTISNEIFTTAIDPQQCFVACHASVIGISVHPMLCYCPLNEKNFLEMLDDVVVCSNNYDGLDTSSDDTDAYISMYRKVKQIVQISSSGSEPAVITTSEYSMGSYMYGTSEYSKDVHVYQFIGKFSAVYYMYDRICICDTETAFQHETTTEQATPRRQTAFKKTKLQNKTTPEETTPTRTTAVKTASHTTTNSLTTVDTASITGERLESKVAVYVSVPIAVTVIAVVILLCVVLWKRKQRQQTKPPEAEYMGGMQRQVGNIESAANATYDGAFVAKRRESDGQGHDYFVLELQDQHPTNHNSRPAADDNKDYDTTLAFAEMNRDVPPDGNVYNTVEVKVEDTYDHTGHGPRNATEAGATKMLHSGAEDTYNHVTQDGGYGTAADTRTHHDDDTYNHAHYGGLK